MTTRNVLAISDLHIPFEHPKALDFCKRLQDKYDCEKIFFMGDLVDLNMTSFHELTPDGLSASEEVDKAKHQLVPWIKAFPVASICIGSHDARPFRKASASGISSKFIKSYNEIWEAPKTWVWDWKFEYQNVIYMHGARTGKYAFVQNAVDNRQSTVTGHTHSTGGVQFMSSEKDLIWGMNVGCLINIKEFAFAYARDFLSRPVIGAGVVLNEGRLPLFIPMNLGSK